MNIYTTEITIKTPWRGFLVGVSVQYSVTQGQVDLESDIEATDPLYADLIDSLFYSGKTQVTRDFGLQLESDIQQEIKKMLDTYAAEVKAAGSVA